MRQSNGLCCYIQGVCAIFAGMLGDFTAAWQSGDGTSLQVHPGLPAALHDGMLLGCHPSIMGRRSSGLSLRRCAALHFECKKHLSHILGELDFEIV